MSALLKKIAIYGAGGLGKEIRALIGNINDQSHTWDFVGFYDDYKSGGPEVLGGMKELNENQEDISIVIALGDPLVKKKIIAEIDNAKIQFATLIHPNVSLGDLDRIHIGVGSVITSGCVLTTDISLGNHVLLNLNSTVGHDVKLGDYSSVMPGSNIAGSVIIESCVYIGSGCNVINGLTIGFGSIIGAGAVVIRDVTKKSTAVGVPANVVKRHA